MDAGQSSAAESVGSNSVEQGSGLEPQKPILLDENTSARRSGNNNDANGCRACKCRRSRCLELDCGCFSAGYYCADICSCDEHCLNKPDYEDTVLDVREKIELRNPGAFAPKVLDTGSSTNTTEHEQHRPRVCRKLNF